MSTKAVAQGQAVRGAPCLSPFAHRRRPRRHGSGGEAPSGGKSGEVEPTGGGSCGEEPAYDGSSGMASAGRPRSGVRSGGATRPRSRPGYRAGMGFFLFIFFGF